MLMIAFTLVLAADTDLIPALKPLDPLVGHCWAGTPERSKDNPDTHCFSSAFGGKAVVDRHVVQNDPLYCGETWYVADGDGIRYVYINSLGGISEGTATAVEDGLDFGDEVYAEDGGPERVFASTLRFNERGDYITETREITGGMNKRMRRDLFERQPDLRVDAPAGYKTCAK